MMSVADKRKDIVDTDNDGETSLQLISDGILLGSKSEVNNQKIITNSNEVNHTTDKEDNKNLVCNPHMRDRTKKKELLMDKDKEVKKKKEEMQREEKKLQKVEAKRQKELKREEEKRKRELRKEEEKKKRELKRCEEKKRKDEQLRIKEEKRRLKEEEKKKKDDERKLKEEEKRIKYELSARSQSKIGNFFKKASITKCDILVDNDYKKSFLPYYIKHGINMANQFNLSKHELSNAENRIDMEFKRAEYDDIGTWLQRHQKKRGFDILFSAVDLLQQINLKDKTDDELQLLLKTIPQKYIKFHENVRPPYVGTYSKKISLPIGDPFDTKSTGFNYDYDSDLDWMIEDEDGGEIDDLEIDEEEEDEEEEPDISDENEFDGFLDNENNVEIPSKGKLIGPLIPTIKLKSDLENLSDEYKDYFKMVVITCLHKDQQFPINPNFVMHKHIPSDDFNNKDDSVPRKKSKTLIIENSDLLEFFNEVHDSTFSLGTISEIVQKRMPQYSKETIKNTVKEYAARSSGKGNTVRKWEIQNLRQWEEMKNQTKT